MIAPWNLPVLTATNEIFPAQAVGNAVILKHLAQTRICKERSASAFVAAGLPEGVFQLLMTTNGDTARLIEQAHHDHVLFTASVEVGRDLQKAKAGDLSELDLELGGKDPADVLVDANIGFEAERIVGAAFFNSDQSCCGIERVYVHRDVYADFVAKVVGTVTACRLGNPTDADVTLGPFVSTKAAGFVRGQTAEAVGQGARTLIDPPSSLRTRRARPIWPRRSWWT